MNISIAVFGAPYSSQSAYTAYRFARAALEAGNKVSKVFFYQDGVYNGNLLAAPPRDEFDVFSAWRQLHQQHGVELVICVAAALRRGVLDEGEARRHDKPAHNLAPEFQIAGLGQLVEMAATSDRLVTFGA